MNKKGFGNSMEKKDNEVYLIWCWSQPEDCYDDEYEESEPWIDSVWSDEEDAIKEAHRLEADVCGISCIHVIGTKMNVRGEGQDKWRDSIERMVLEL